ncbi:MAG: ornithine--oxo-acid transaminase [Ardenticatenales bacterium]|nr:ornithine--oxo-acid transaminase [Ardenticatenales bacterium]
MIDTSSDASDVQAPSSHDYIALEERYGAHNYRPLDVVLSGGLGSWVWDVDGKRYLDCLAAYGAVNQGHNHPRIVAAFVEQAQRMALTSRAFRNDKLGPFYRILCEMTGYQRVLPMNTGAEAVETALKAARKWGYTVKGIPDGQAEIIVMAGNFGGRTITIISFSDEPQYRAGFGPFTPGFKLVPFGDADAIERAITPNTCAVLLEPIQGEAGIIVPPHGTLKRIRAICDANNVLMIADEIQSGLGRTGLLMACDHEGVRPDGVTLGKALAGGMYPVSAFLADDAVMDVFQPGDHGSTFGGNPLGAAVATEALTVLRDEGMVENAAAMGRRFGAGLESFDHGSIKEVRQVGLWIGIELWPEAGGARRYCEDLQGRGVLCKETHHHVIRIAPPLVIGPTEVDHALETLHASFDHLG